MRTRKELTCENSANCEPEPAAYPIEKGAGRQPQEDFGVRIAPHALEGRPPHEDPRRNRSPPPGPKSFPVRVRQRTSPFSRSRSKQMFVDLHGNCRRRSRTGKPEANAPPARDALEAQAIQAWNPPSCESCCDGFFDGAFRTGPGPAPFNRHGARHVIHWLNRCLNRTLGVKCRAGAVSRMSTPARTAPYALKCLTRKGTAGTPVQNCPPTSNQGICIRRRRGRSVFQPSQMVGRSPPAGGFSPRASRPGDFRALAGAANPNRIAGSRRPRRHMRAGASPRTPVLGPEAGIGPATTAAGSRPATSGQCNSRQSGRPFAAISAPDRTGQWPVTGWLGG